jgi:hypothetical protein
MARFKMNALVIIVVLVVFTVFFCFSVLRNVPLYKYDRMHRHPEIMATISNVPNEILTNLTIKVKIRKNENQEVSSKDLEHLCMNTVWKSMGFPKEIIIYDSNTVDVVVYTFPRLSSRVYAYYIYHDIANGYEQRSWRLNSIKTAE